MMKRRVLIIFSLAFFAPFLWHCGYRFSSGEKVLKGYHRIYVDNFVNRTVQENLEMLFRNAFIDEVIRDGRLAIVTQKEGADLIVAGEIKNVLSSPLAYRSGNWNAEQRLTVTLSLTLTERESQKTLWQEEGFTYWVDYLVTPSGDVMGEQNKQSALRKLASEVSEKLYRLMFASF